MNHIVFSGGRFYVTQNGVTVESDCKMISHYKNVSEQLRKSHDWKASTDHVFGDVYMMPLSDSYFEPRVNGIASVSGDYFYYGLELEKGGGVYKKSKTDPDDEGFIFTSNDIVPQHLHADGSRLTCSMKYHDGTSHIAMFLSERPDYFEFTGGDSIDEHPFIYNGKIFFDSAGIRRDESGSATLGNKGISVYDIEKRTVTQLFYSENDEYLLPKLDSDGNLYCIRRPRKKDGSVGGAVVGLITAPFWIFAALVGFLSAFVRIFTGKQLMGKSNRDKAKESAKEIIDGCDIDIELEEKRNAKAGEKYPGYAPQSWELIKIENGAYIDTEEKAIDALNKAKRICRGVIGFEITEEGIVTSNGKCILLHNEGKTELVTKGEAINRNFTVINV